MKASTIYLSCYVLAKQFSLRLFPLTCSVTNKPTTMQKVFAVNKHGDVCSDSGYYHVVYVFPFRPFKRSVVVLATDGAHCLRPSLPGTSIKPSRYKLFHIVHHRLSDVWDSYCLMSYCAGAWHYRIFPDFLNSGFKMASKIEGKAKVIACS